MHARGAVYPDPLRVEASGCSVPVSLRYIATTATTQAKLLRSARVFVSVVVVIVVALGRLVCAHARARVTEQ
jgi:hypothetical protein